MTLKSPYFDAQHLDQAVLCLAIAEVQHDDIQEIVLPLLCAILQYPYKLVITPTLRVLRGSLCSCRGVTNRQQQQRHLIHSSWKASAVFVTGKKFTQQDPMPRSQASSII